MFKRASWTVGLIFAGGLGAGLLPLRAAEVPCEGRIVTVTVYTSGLARVTRERPLSLPAGGAVLVSAPLPPKADASSVQVGLSAPGVRIESVEARRKAPDEARKDKAAKTETARSLWVPAMNNHGGFGRWAFIEISDPWDAKNTIRAMLPGYADIIKGEKNAYTA
ncbi:MAG: DUF4140 domain-containing protein [Planctomycetota bacterium]